MSYLHIAQVSFFLLGKSISGFRSTPALELSSGHSLHSHSFDHPSLPTLTAAGVRSRCRYASFVTQLALGCFLLLSLTFDYLGELLISSLSLLSLLLLLATNRALSKERVPFAMEAAEDLRVCVMGRGGVLASGMSAHPHWHTPTSPPCPHPLTGSTSDCQVYS